MYSALTLTLTLFVIVTSHKHIQAIHLLKNATCFLLTKLLITKCKHLKLSEISRRSESYPSSPPRLRLKLRLTTSFPSVLILLLLWLLLWLLWLLLLLLLLLSMMMPVPVGDLELGLELSSFSSGIL